MTDRASWQITTHEWGKDLDREHLAEARSRLSQGEVAGGLRHLILEVLAYAHDEAESLGRVGTAVVTHHPDGSISVTDDGRGTDTRTDHRGQVIRKPVMATPDVRFRDEASAPLLPDGLPRRGMSTVAALSHELTHANHRPSGSWSQTYRHGIPDSALVTIAPREHSGTSVTFQAVLAGPSHLTESDASGLSWLKVVNERG